MRQYDTMSEVQKALLEPGRVIDLVGEVDGQMMRYVREACTRLIAKGSPDIRVIITSCGGEVLAGLDICDMLATYPGKKTGIVVSEASSMGAIILQICTVRQATQHASLLIHHVSRMLSLGLTPDELQVEIKKGNALQERLDHILTTRTGRSRDEIQAECKKNRNMTAEEALAFGLIDEILPIVIPKPTVKDVSAEEKK